MLYTSIARIWMLQRRHTGYSLTVVFRAPPSVPGEPCTHLLLLPLILLHLLLHCLLLLLHFLVSCLRLMLSAPSSKASLTGRLIPRKLLLHRPRHLRQHLLHYPPLRCIRRFPLLHLWAGTVTELPPPHIHVAQQGRPSLGPASPALGDLLPTLGA